VPEQPAPLAHGVVFSGEPTAKTKLTLVDVPMLAPAKSSATAKYNMNKSMREMVIIYPPPAPNSSPHHISIRA